MSQQGEVSLWLYRSSEKYSETTLRELLDRLLNNRSSWHDSSAVVTDSRFTATPEHGVVGPGGMPGHLSSRTSIPVNCGTKYGLIWLQQHGHPTSLKTIPILAKNEQWLHHAPATSAASDIRPTRRLHWLVVQVREISLNGTMKTVLCGDVDR